MSKLNRILSIIILIILSFSLAGCRTKIQKLQDDLNNNNYSDAVNQFNKISNDGDKTYAIKLLNDKTQEIRQQFLDGTIDGTRAISNIQKFREISEMEDTLNQDIDEINSLMNSQKAFSDGQRAEKESNYELAYESYYDVIPSDSTNYAQAQEKLAQLESKVISSLPATIEGTEIIINSISYKKSYPDQMQVLLKNRSNKIINKFRISILGYDKNGNSVEVQGQYDNYENYEFIGSGDNFRIKPNETWGHDYGWSLSSNHKIENILACVIDIQFSDGTTWINPLYKPWLDKHFQKTLS